MSYLLPLSDDRLGLELLRGERPPLGVKVHARDGGQGQVLRCKLHLHLQLPLLLLLLALCTGALTLRVEEVIGCLKHTNEDSLHSAKYFFFNPADPTRDHIGRPTGISNPA